MAKTIKVNLEFNANTQKAQQEMSKLQQQLSTLVNNSAANTGSLSINKQLHEAQQSAMDLKIALNNAFNQDTGKLNLNKFQTELKKSGRSIEQYAQQMRALGPEGVKAFSQIAKTIAQADTKIFSLQGGMKKLADTFMNTLRWQITSTAIQGVTSGISETVDYAKELDTSLNNIRIVTGKSAESMAKFAKEANQVAKNLSTTTTKVTDASLIYYQQGLSDAEVAKRAETTIKLANVVGEEAATVSEWMTAIWNNFDDGSEKLEYYADVLAELGAATASSADEIAQGLEKFAAVAETVGLSYEYATSALATVTAETRQSADVVGTAFKTLFARMEGLKLGETLDDGTTLNQYSLALQTAGVNIKDANGELRNMDAILADTGKRWETLTKDQQIALAQSVAGIRQYNQFMALMDNWDVMEKNLELTEKANGALQSQQEIYEESMAASQERLKTATEAIKTTLLGSDDLIPWIDGAAKALEIINDLLEAVGGLPTILLAVAAALTKVYQPQVANCIAQSANAMVNFANSAKNFAKGNGFQASTSYKSNVTNMAANMATQGLDDSGIAESRFLKDNTKLQITYLENENKMNAATKQRIQWEMEILELKQQQIVANEKSIKKLNDDNAAQENTLREAGMSKKTADMIQEQAQFKGKGLAQGELALGTAVELQTSGATMTKSGRTEAANELKEHLNKAVNNAKELDIAAENIDFDEAYKSLDAFVENGKTDISELINKIKEFNSALAGTTVAGVTEGAIEIANSSSHQTAKGIQEMQNIDGRSSLDNMASTLNKIDESSLSDQGNIDFINSSKNKIKTLQDERKALMDNKKALEDQRKTLEKAGKSTKTVDEALQKNSNKLQDNKRKTTELGKEIKKNAKNFKTNEKELSKATTGTEDFGDAVKDTTGKVEEYAEGVVKETKASEAQGEAMDGMITKTDELANSMANGGQGFTHWSETLTAGISGLATYVMGLNMLSSSFEQMGQAVASGNHSWSDWISNLSTAFMSLGMLIPMISKIYSWTSKTIQQKQQEKILDQALNKLSKLKKTQKEKEIMLSKVAAGATKEEMEAEYGEAGAEVVNAYAGVAEQFGEGPLAWPGAIASLAAIAPIALMVGAAAIGGISGAKQGAQEKRDEEIETATENIEAINENQKLATSVSDLTQEYKALSAAGESTTDVLSDMKDQIPDLIDSYKELGKTLNETIDTTALEQAYKYFEATGDVSQFEAEQKKLDKQIADTEYENAVAGANAARISALSVQKGGNDGRWKKNGNYKVKIGGAGKGEATASKEVEAVMGELYNKGLDDFKPGGVIQFDVSTNAGFVEGYQKMQEAAKRLEEQDLEKTDIYRELNRELSEMRDYYEQILPFMDEFYNLAEIEFKENEVDILGKYATSIDSLAEFNQEKQNIIEQLQNKFPNITTEQAELLLGQSKILSGFVEANNAFEEGAVRTTQVLENMGKTGLNQIKEWFAALPEDERTLAIGIDFTNVNSIEDAEKLLAEKLKEARDAAIVLEAEKLEVTDKVFEAYTENFAEANGEMDKNATITKQLALNNLKLQKGFEDLTKSWSKDISILQKANKNTLEYAETISKVQDALEKMFGARPSTDWVEGHLEQIDKIASGDIETLYELQDSLAKDYVLNMEFTTSLDNDIWSGTIKDAQSVLNELLDDLDTSIEIGEGATLSGDYLNELQNMLDAGVITSEQLQQVFRAKGYEYEVTDWKRVPGPTKGITRTIYENGEKKGTEYVEETEDILVPIINGQTSSVKGGKTPVLSKDQKEGTGNNAYEMKAYKSNNPKSLDMSSLEDASKKKKDADKKLEKEIERYHEIDKAIETVERDLDSIASAKDRAFGADKISLMDKEIAKQKESIELEKQRLKEAENYYDLDRKKILENYAVNLNSDGNITNYNDLVQKQIDKIKSLPIGSDEREAAEEYLDQMKEDFDQYEETLAEVEEQQQKVREEQYALQDLALEKIEYKVNIKVDAADDDIAYIEFLMTRIEDDAFAVADAVSLWGQNADAVLKKFEATEQGIQQVMNDVAAQGYMTDAQSEYLKNARQELMDYTTELQELRTNVQEKLTEAYDAWNEKLDQNFSRLEHQKSQLKHLNNIIDIIGKDALGISDETMLKMADTSIEVANNNIESAKARLESDQAILDDYKKKLANATTEEDKKYWQEQVDDMTEQVAESQEELNSKLEEGLETTVSKFQQTVEIITKNFSKAVSGIYGTIENMRDEWERMGEVNERYLKDYEKTYEISKLMRNINKSIDTTDNVKNKKELNNLQKEIQNMTKDGQKLSKYDLEYLQKKYDLLLAEQALKDKQNTKSTVRLKRDSQGNFGYVYTADAAEVDKAQQEYEDKVYAYQEFVNKMETELTEYFIATQEKMQEEIQAAADKYGYGTDEFFQELERIEARYAEDMDYITTEYGEMTTRNIEINKEFNTGVADTYHETFLGKIHPDYDNFETLYENTTANVSDACNNLGIAITDFRDNYTYQLQLAGYDTTDFDSTASTALDNIKNKSKETKDEIKTLTDHIKTEMPLAADAVETFQKDYAGYMGDILTRTNNVYKKVGELIARFGELETAANKDFTPPGDDENKGGTGAGGGVGDDKDNDIIDKTPTDFSLEDAETEVIDDTVTYLNLPTLDQTHEHAGKQTELLAHGDSSFDLYPWKDNADGKKKITIAGRNLDNVPFTILNNQLYSKDNQKFIMVQALMDIGSDIVKGASYYVGAKYANKYPNKTGYYSFDTGGYTGSWGPEGRLAMLHQKEIVLNARDTENLLTAVSMIREISDKLESNALAMRYLSAIGNYNAAINTNNHDTLQQEITIHAEFPNATNHSEIEEAFDNLVNLASQYANRK